MSDKLTKILDEIAGLTLLEVSDLIKMMEEKFGVKAAVGGGMMMAMPGAAAAPAEEEKTEFNVVLVEAGANKINVIKEVRAITGLGLKEAKELVESAPKAVKEAVSKEDAAKFKKQLEDAGAKVDVK